MKFLNFNLKSLEKLKIFQRKTILILAMLLLPIVYSIPQLPCEYWGKVMVNGQLASGQVTAELNGRTYTADISQGYYKIRIDADDPETAAVEGGKEGDKVILKFQNLEKEVAWNPGSVREDFLIGSQQQEQEQQPQQQQSTTRSSSSSSSSSGNVPSSASTVYVGYNEKKEIKTVEETFTPLAQQQKITTASSVKKPFLTPLNLFLLASFFVKLVFLGMLLLIIVIYRR